jgi:hypothetical protein
MGPQVLFNLLLILCNFSDSERRQITDFKNRRKT